MLKPKKTYGTKYKPVTIIRYQVISNSPAKPANIWQLQIEQCWTCCSAFNWINLYLNYFSSLFYFILSSEFISSGGMKCKATLSSYVSKSWENCNFMKLKLCCKVSGDGRISIFLLISHIKNIYCNGGWLQVEISHFQNGHY